jgi:hypothetical protein
MDKDKFWALLIYTATAKAALSWVKKKRSGLFVEVDIGTFGTAIFNRSQQILKQVSLNSVGSQGHLIGRFSSQ